MRIGPSSILLLFSAVLAACDAADPLQPDSAIPAQFAPASGTGNPTTDAQLAEFNSAVVGCSQAGEFDYRRASTVALLTSILRFTPSPEAKQEALLQAIVIQIEQGQRRGEVSERCATMLTEMIDAIDV